MASPTVNTAEWTVTWPDGTEQTQIAQDYVYITDDDGEGKRLFIGKQLLSPLGGTVISDTITFRITLTNVTGMDLAGVLLEDHFDIHPTIWTWRTARSGGAAACCPRP